MAERLTPRDPDLEVHGSSLARRVVSLDKELYSTLSFVYKWVPVLYCWGGGGGGVTLRWTSFPSGGSGSTPSHAS